VSCYVACVVANFLFVEQCDFGFDVMHPAVLVQVLEEEIVDIPSARLLLAR